MNFFDLAAYLQLLSDSPLRNHLRLLLALSPYDALQLLKLVLLIPQLHRHPPLYVQLLNFQGYLRILLGQEEEGLACLKQSRRQVILVGSPKTQMCLKVNRHLALSKVRSPVSQNQLLQLQTIMERLRREGWPDELNCVQLICNLAMSRYNYSRNLLKLSESFYRKTMLCQVRTPRLQDEKALGLSQLALLLSKLDKQQQSLKLCQQIYNLLTCSFQLRNPVGHRIRQNLQLCLKLNSQSRPYLTSVLVVREAYILQQLRMQIKEYQSSRLEYMYIIRKVQQLSPQNRSQAESLYCRVSDNLFHGRGSPSSLRSLLYSIFEQDRVNQRRLLQFQSILKEKGIEVSLVNVQKQLLLGAVDPKEKRWAQSRLVAQQRLRLVHSKSLDELFPQHQMQGLFIKPARKSKLDEKEQRILRRKSAIQARINSGKANHSPNQHPLNQNRTSQTITQLYDPAPLQTPLPPFQHMEHFADQLKGFVEEAKEEQSAEAQEQQKCCLI